MKKVIMILMAVALVALPTMAQKFKEHDQQSMQFQSTSAMAPINSQYSAQPLLNADGTAVYSAGQETNSNSSQRPGGGPRRADAYTPPTPVGDPILPLLLFAGAYLAWNLFFRRKRAEER